MAKDIATFNLNSQIFPQKLETEIKSGFGFK